MLAGHLLKPADEAESRVAQVLGIDGVGRGRHRHLHAGGLLLAVVGDHRGAPLPGAAHVDPVQLHEPHRLVALQLVGGGGVQPAPHEGQVGVGVSGLGGPLLVGELGAATELVVDVAGVGRKELLEDLEVILDVGAVVVEDLREALVQEARRGVVRYVEGPRIAGEVGAELLAKLASHVDQVDAGGGLDAERGLEGAFSGPGVPVHQNHGRLGTCAGGPGRDGTPPGACRPGAGPHRWTRQSMGLGSAVSISKAGPDTLAGIRD